MRQTLLILLLLLSALASPAAVQPRIDSLLEQLDGAIEQREHFIAAREARIDSLRTLYVAQADPRRRYDLGNELIDQYVPYCFDSTMSYILAGRAIAEQLRDPELEHEATLRMSHTLTSGGMYLEALETLEEIDPARLDVETGMLYYRSLERAYYHLARYASCAAGDYSLRYQEASRRYLDSMLVLASPGSGERLGIEARRCVASGNYPEAKRILRDYLAMLPYPSHDYAIVASTLAYAYRDAPEGDNQAYYLILSAICDVRGAVMENESLRNLSNLLLEQGDIDRAYRYTTISMEDANFYNSSLRRIEIARTQPLIERAYRSKIDEQHRRLRGYTVLLGVMLVILLVSFWQLAHRARALAKARRRLEQLNVHLIDSTHIKEEYIGHFMCLCSSYIDKLERYQRAVAIRIAAGKWDELRAMSRSSEVIDHEIKEFYDNFDRTFLQLYPDFVTEFNRLLRPEEHVVLGKGELLNTELRIFALIRLGIGDSSQIAKFLRYSANTVYTYRTKAKNKAIDRANFERQIARINLY